MESSASSDSDDDDVHDYDFEDTQQVVDSFSFKHAYTSESGSDSSESSLCQDRKRGKAIHQQPLVASVQKHPADVPLPDDDDELTQDPNLINPKNPKKDNKFLSKATDSDIMDYPLTQPTPTHKINRAASQSSDSFSVFM